MKKFKSIFYILLAVLFCFTSCGNGDVFRYSWKIKSGNPSELKITGSVKGGYIDIDSDIAITVGFGQINLKKRYSEATLRITAIGFDVYRGDSLVGTDHCEIKYSDFDDEKYIAVRLSEGGYKMKYHEVITLKVSDKSKISKSIGFLIYAGQEADAEGNYDTASEVIDMYFKYKDGKIKFEK